MDDKKKIVELPMEELAWISFNEKIQLAQIVKENKKLNSETEFFKSELEKANQKIKEIESKNQLKVQPE